MADIALFRPLEALLERKIAASTPARRQLHSLRGKAIAIRVRNSSLQLFLSTDESSIRIHGTYAEEPDAIIEGTLPALTGMSLGKDRAMLRSEQLSIIGDTSVAADFRELLRLAQPDWEEELSRLVGDVAAHQIGNFARETLRWGQQAVDIFSANVREFLQEESREDRKSVV